MKNKVEFLVAIDVPTSMTPKQVAQQIREDIGSWAGTLEPNDPMYGLAKAKRTVKIVK